MYSALCTVHCGRHQLRPRSGQEEGSRPMGASQGAMAGITGEDLSVGKEPYPGYFQGKPYQIQADDVDFWEPAAPHHPTSFFSRFEGPRSCHVTAKQEERPHVELCGIGVRLTHDEDGHAVLIQRVVSKHLCAARRSVSRRTDPCTDICWKSLTPSCACADSWWPRLKKPAHTHWP